MRKKIIWVLLCILGLSTAIYFFNQFYRSNENDVNKIHKSFNQKKEFLKWITETAQKQTRLERFFIHGKLIKSVEFDTSFVKLYHPYNFLIDSQNFYFVLDWATQQIHKYDSNGVYLFSFGKGKGSGPQFFNNITDYKIFSTYLYVNDPTQGKIEIYDARKGKFLRSFKFEVPVNKFLPISNSLFVGKVLIPTQYFLGIFQNQRLVDTVLEQYAYSKKTNLVSDVHILNHFDDIFVVFVMGGYFLRYNILHKKVFFLSQTIVPVDFPEVEQPNPYVMRISPERKISAFSASIADGKLMIFSYRALQQSIADFYSLKQGRYKFSVMLERKYLDLRYHSERIYSLYKQGVDIYAVENGSD